MTKKLAMFDDVNVSLLPPGYDLYAAYADGTYENITAVRTRFPKAHILAIDVRASYRNGDVLDVETGDATPDQAPAWFKAREGHTTTPKPILYTSASQITTLVTAMSKAGIARDRYYIWSAHYTGRPHICGRGCGYPRADGTQWTDKALGRSLDESLMRDYMITKPEPKPKPAPAPNRVQRARLLLEESLRLLDAAPPRRAVVHAQARIIRGVLARLPQR